MNPNNHVSSVEARINSNTSPAIRLLWHAFNWGVVASAWAAGYYGSQNVRWNGRRFSANDVYLSQQFHEDSVSGVSLVAVGMLVPLVVFLLFFAPKLACAWGQRSLVNRLLLMLYWWAFAHIAGFALTVAFTDLAKRLSQHFRPDWLERCFGSLSAIPSDYFNPGVLLTVANCTTTSSKILSDGRLSFPSGHASSSTFASVFTVFFLYEQLHSKGKTLDHVTQGWKYIIYLLPLPWCVGVSFSRIFDNRHHPLDVLFGMILGFIIALLTRIFMHANLQRDAFPLDEAAAAAGGGAGGPQSSAAAAAAAAALPLPVSAAPAGHLQQQQQGAAAAGDLAKRNSQVRVTIDGF